MYIFDDYDFLPYQIPLYYSVESWKAVENQFFTLIKVRNPKQEK